MTRSRPCRTLWTEKVVSEALLRPQREKCWNSERNWPNSNQITNKRRRLSHRAPCNHWKLRSQRNLRCLPRPPRRSSQLSPRLNWLRTLLVHHWILMRILLTTEWATNYPRTKTKTKRQRVLYQLHSKSNRRNRPLPMHHKKMLQNLPDLMKVRALKLLLQRRVRRIRLHLLRVKIIRHLLQRRRMITTWTKQLQNLRICQKKYQTALMEHQARR